MASHTESTECLTRRFFVGNIPFSATPDTLANHLGIKQEEKDFAVEIVKHQRTGKSKGYGFVTVPSHKVDELLKLNGGEFDGRKLQIAADRDRQGKTRWFSTESGAMVTRPHRGQAPAQNLPFCFPLIDIGANLTHRKYNHDLNHVIHRAKSVGVEKIMVTGTSVWTVEAAEKLSRNYQDYLYFTSGIHPHDAKSWTDDTEAVIEKLAASPNCVAIGECGLDYNRNFSPPEKQREVFEKQVQLACKLKKPLFLHEREAHTDFSAILSKYQADLPPVVVHCFTGTKQEALSYLQQGYYIGLTGFLLKEKEDDGVINLLSSGDLPLDKLLLETDCPFMYPNLKRAKAEIGTLVKDRMPQETADMVATACNPGRNEPCALPLIAEVIAACMDVETDALAQATTKNAYTVFGLK